MKKSLLIIFLVILIDQVVKFYIKLHFEYGESVDVFGDWFKLYFVENPGMAFGLEFGGVVGKYLLSIFRIASTVIMFFILAHYHRSNATMWVKVGMSLVIGGAIGNIIDGTFYGIIFDESTYQYTATFLPENGGYAPLLQGRVVDMLYFPLIDTQLPSWLPIFGGENFQFFKPIFNIADTAVSFGVGLLILFRKEAFSK